MKRLWVVALSILFGSLFAFYYRTVVSAAEVGEYDNYTSWAPDAATVSRHFSGDTKQPAKPGETQMNLFSELVTQRFRNHEPKKAVRVKFEHDALNNRDLMVLMCPARMEPWNMDWLAVTTWREAKADLGVSYPLDIFITYIGLSRVKVAELRPIPGAPDKVAIHYRTPDQVHGAMVGSQTTANGPSVEPR